jgi:hypothetical protein
MNSTLRSTSSSVTPSAMLSSAQQLEHGRDTDDARDLDAGAALREVAHHAVDHRAPVVEQNLPGSQGARAWGASAFFHGCILARNVNGEARRRSHAPGCEMLKAAPVRTTASTVRALDPLHLTGRRNDSVTFGSPGDP